MVELRRALENDIQLIEDILLDAVNWLDSISKPLWTRGQVTWERLSRDYSPSDFVIAS